MKGSMVRTAVYAEGKMFVLYQAMHALTSTIRRVRSRFHNERRCLWLGTARDSSDRHRVGADVDKFRRDQSAKKKKSTRFPYHRCILMLCVCVFFVRVPRGDIHPGMGVNEKNKSCPPLLPFCPTRGQYFHKKKTMPPAITVT